MPNYKPKTSHSEAPLQILNNSTDTGYAVKLPNKSAVKSSSWNAVLVTHTGDELFMWIEDVVIDFSLSGSTGQSRFRKQFYPKAFNQPVAKVSGTMPNQSEYNRLAAFIRESHYDALSAGNQKTIKLMIRGMKKDAKRNIKGGHKPMVFEGYIKSIPAGSIKFEFAPKFQFEFVIAQSNGQIGIYKDDLVLGSTILSWMDAFKKDHWGAMSGTELDYQQWLDSNSNSNGPGATSDVGNILSTDQKFGIGLSSNLNDIFNIK
jgi:hypothetical protein